jgi:FkbM family methyltransferase
VSHKRADRAPEADFGFLAGMGDAMTEGAPPLALPLQKNRGGLRRVVREVARPFEQISRLLRTRKTPTSPELSQIRGMIAELQGAIAEVRAGQTRMIARIEETDRKFGAVNDLQASTLRRATRQPMPVADGLLLVSLDNRWVAAPSNDYLLIRVLLEHPVYEPGVSSILRQLATGKAYIIDVGANIGLHSFTMALAMRADGKLLALEPTPRTFDALRASITLNMLLTRIDARPIAAGQHSGEMILHCHPCALWNSLFAYPDIETHQISVPVMPLDALVPAGTAVDLVKIDAEGAEFEVLKGMRRILSEAQDIAVVLEFSATHFVRAGASPAELIQFMAAFGLVPQLIDDRTGSLEAFDLEQVLALPAANVLFRTARPS